MVNCQFLRKPMNQEQVVKQGCGCGFGAFAPHMYQLHEFSELEVAHDFQNHRLVFWGHC